MKEQGRLDEAEANYKGDNTDDYAEAPVAGVALQDQDRLAEAESSYSDAIILKPDFTEARLNRWKLLFDRQELRLH